MHLHEECPKDKIYWTGIIQMMKVRELAGFDNYRITEHILEFVGFDKEKFKKIIQKKIKKLQYTIPLKEGDMIQ